MNRKATIIITATTLLCGAVAYFFRHELFDMAKKTISGNYFTIDELCASSTAKAKGINNTPTEAVKRNLTDLINNCLNPIRETYGKPIIISSGYRCPALNVAVGGASNSQHTTGQAADLVPASGGSLQDIFQSAIKCGNFDQLIYEQNSKGSKWVHVSYDASRHRGQILSYKNGTYTDITNNWKTVVA